MIRTLIKLAIVVVVVHAAVKIVPVFWTYVKFKDAVTETARFSSRRSQDEITTRVLAIAERYDLPISRGDIEVRKVEDRTYVNTRYSVQLEYFPSKFYPWDFVVNVEGVPPRYSGVIP